MKEIFDAKLSEINKIFRINFIPNIDKAVLRFVTRLYSGFVASFQPSSVEEIPEIMKSIFKEIKMDGKVITSEEVYKLWRITIALPRDLEQAKIVVLSDIEERLVHPLANEAISGQKDIDLFTMFHVYQDYAVIKSLKPDLFPPECLCNKYQESLMGSVIHRIEKLTRNMSSDEIRSLAESIPVPMDETDPRKLLRKKIEKIINVSRKNETYSAFLDACLNNPIWPPLREYLLD